MDPVCTACPTGWGLFHTISDLSYIVCCTLHGRSCSHDILTFSQDSYVAAAITASSQDLSGGEMARYSLNVDQLPIKVSTLYTVIHTVDIRIHSVESHAVRLLCAHDCCNRSMHGIVLGGLDGLTVT